MPISSATPTSHSIRPLPARSFSPELETGLFTGKKLPQYFNKTAEDWINARRIVNKLDKAPQIAAYAKRFYGAIGYTTG